MRSLSKKSGRERRGGDGLGQTVKMKFLFQYFQSVGFFHAKIPISETFAADQKAGKPVHFSRNKIISQRDGRRSDTTHLYKELCQ